MKESFLSRRNFIGAGVPAFTIVKPELVGYSAVPFEEDMKWVPFKGESHAANAPYPFVLGGAQIFPTTVAKDKVALYVYGARTQDLTWQTTPKTNFLGRADGAGDGAAALVLQIDPAAPKAASLDIKVTKKGTNDTKTVTVPTE